MPESLVVEYQLQPILEVALKQGLIPVALTGRFLRNLTHRGFLWLPGLKYIHEGVHGDIDIVASCDGHIVLVECKSRDQSDPATIEWPKILEQMKALAAIGRACKASFVLLASMIDSYPQSIVEEVVSIGTAELPVHLLNRVDLEKGHRWIKEEPFTMSYPLPLIDLIQDAFPEVTLPQFDEPREIVTGLMTQSFGSITPPLVEPGKSRNQGQSEGK